MIKFFRKVRFELIKNRVSGKYLKYALGEIILVVIGILIALQLNNWNEARKNENQFKAVLQQIYTVIDQDEDQLVLTNYGLTVQMDIIDSMVLNPENIPPKLLPHLLYYIDLFPAGINSEVAYQLSYLNFNPENLNQSNLNKSLSSYGNSINEKFSTSRTYLTPFLEKINLPLPGNNFGYSILNDAENMDTSFFSDPEIERATQLLADPLFQNALKSARSGKALSSVFIANMIDLTRTNKAAIRQYFPKVKLLYSNIGLVGEATANKSWNENIPLTLTNDLEAIWEADVVLADGSVKFREGENWNFNWGGMGFPTGISQPYGNDIKVKAGSYHVVLNLSDKTYRFIENKN